MRRAVIVVLSLAAASPAVAQQDVRPADRAAFLAFRTLHLDALAHRDARRVPWVVRADSPFRATMTAVLRLGGSSSADHAFEAPHVFVRLHDGPSGYVDSHYARRPTDHRAINADTPTPGARS